jgi:hypothetical protein
MSKGSSSAPAPIDINQAIRTQAESNRVNVFSPQGTATYDGTYVNGPLLNQTGAYTGSKAVDKSCRSHGSCPACRASRERKIKRAIPAPEV